MNADLVPPLLDLADTEALDAQLSSMAAGLAPPPPGPGEAVLVVGPWLAGVSTLAAALRERMPERRFVEVGELAPGTAPTGVIFAVSAVAPLAESDCALLDDAVRGTDLVIGALTKIDVHRDWRAVLAADAELVGMRTARLRDMPWVGVAAGPAGAEAQLDDLVEVLRRRLDADPLERRNRLRAWETHLCEEIGAAEATADHASTALHRRRDDLLRAARLSRSGRSMALRSRIQQARVQLGHFARNRCASVRTELSEDVAEWGGLLPWDRGRRRAEAFRAYAHDRAAEIVGEIDSGISEQLRDIATESGLAAPAVPPAALPPELGAPVLTARRLETQLMLLLGAGFGLGVALAAGRLLAGLAPGSAAVGAIGGALLGALLTVWVVGIRDLLQDRVLLDRWVGRVTATLREHAEALVATRVLAAEVDLTGQAAVVDERLAERTARQVDAIDAELRDRALAAARTQRSVEARLAELRTALDAVRTTLNNQTNPVTTQ
ncbi:hypothetical protein V4U86_27330 [Mycobacterium sp. AMU20-3851]|uniref:hypothetical protein n=1 Tax=Mycobacterium sp. AMU20-3851 TaxID=3122055 RepID=UPI00375488F8